MEKVSKETRTKQVQFRMDPDVFYKLKSTVASDRSLHSMADLFNEEAEKLGLEFWLIINGQRVI